VPIGLAVEGANRHDMKLVRATLDNIVVDRPEPTPEQPQNMFLDKDYNFLSLRIVGAHRHLPKNYANSELSHSRLAYLSTLVNTIGCKNNHAGYFL